MEQQDTSARGASLHDMHALAVDLQLATLAPGDAWKGWLAVACSHLDRLPCGPGAARGDG
jgi:hypothetical protein